MTNEHGILPTGRDDELWSLCSAMCDGTIGEDQLARLESLLEADAANRLFCACYFRMNGQLMRVFRPTTPRRKMVDEYQNTIAAELTESGRQVANGPFAITDSLAETPTGALQPSSHFAFPDNTIHGTAAYFSSGWPVAYLVATVICGVGLLIGSRIYVSGPEQIVRQSVPSPSPLAPSPSSRMEFVGRITGMVDCQWADPTTAVPGPVAVPLGRKYALASGLMEITYDTGAKVLLQGPVTYEVESAVSGFLAVGKLTARVEKRGERREERAGLAVQSTKCEVRSTEQAGSGQWAVGSRNPSPSTSNPQSPIPNPSLSTIHYPLFTVRTPTAAVTDLGTEFGVEVNEAGDTTSHVYRGSVRVQSLAADGSVQGAGRVLRENQTATAQKNPGEPIAVLVPSAEPIDFVREISKRRTKTLDLVDVVAGGDGFSGRRNRGIDARSGRATGTLEGDNPMFGDKKYHRAEGIAFVDGVFIPHGDGPVQLDSAGHVYDGFSATDNKTSDYVWAGGQFGGNSAELDGIDYASSGHGQLALCANKGITFDLQAIRRANSDGKLVQFRAVTGNTEQVSEKGEAVYADVWVFVDGQIRFRRREINRYSGAMPVVVPIADNDRFLTLVATDGGNGYHFDHIVFGDPRLELAPVKAAADSTPPSEATKHGDTEGSLPERREVVQPAEL